MKVYSLFSQSYLSTSMQLIETGIQHMELELEGIAGIAQDDFTNPDIINVRYLEEPYSTQDYYRTIVATTDFKRSVSKMNSICDCGIVLSNDIIITPSRIHFSSEDFYRNYFTVDGFESYTAWKQYLLEYESVSNLTSLHGVRSQENREYEALTYIIKLPLASAKSKSFFYATIDKNYLLAYFVTKEMVEKGLLRICDLSGKTLFVHGRSNDTRLIMIRKESSRLGISISVGISGEFFAQKLMPLKIIAYIFFTLYISAGLLLSVIFAYRSSKPIQNIVDAAAAIEENRLHSLVPEKNHNGYSYIMSFLNHADNAFENYEHMMEQQKELLRSNLFERLIRGLVYSASTFERAHFYFPNFPASYSIAAVLLSGLKTLELSAYAARQSLLLSIVTPLLPNHAYVHFTSNFLLILLPAGSSDWEKRATKKLLLEVSNQLLSRSDIPGSVAVSDVFSRMEDLHLAFSQARHILRLYGNTPDRRIYSREDFPETWSNPDPLDDMRFHELLLRAEKEQALGMVDTMLGKIKQSGYVHESEIQQIFYSYRRSFVIIRNELSEPLRSRLSLPRYDPTLNIDALFDRIKCCICIVCKCMEAQQRDKNEAYERSILSYINANINNVDLYTKTVTLYFGISENRLQGIVRKLTGKSFFEYVESQRMSKAERLLCHTVMPISELITQCGYLTLNSFYKAFRRNYGISPTTMRKRQYRGFQSLV